MKSLKSGSTAAAESVKRSFVYAKQYRLFAARAKEQDEFEDYPSLNGVPEGGFHLFGILDFKIR